MQGILTKAAVAAVLTFGVSVSAHAALSVSGSVGGAPNGVSYETFDSLTAGVTTTMLLPSGITISFEPNAMPVSGGSSGQYAPPFLSGSNGTNFGNAPVPGEDNTVYITSGSNTSAGNAAAAATLSFATPQAFFGLLWGSVDDYNTLSFYNGIDLVGSVTGADVTASPNGNQGVMGTLYVNINSSLPFDRVVATSTQFAFEFDNVSFNTTAVPEPASLGLLGVGMLGLAAIRRRKAQRTA